MSKFQSVPVDESALKGRFTGPLILSILAASFGSSFIFGYNIGCINSAGDTIKRWIAESLEYIPANFSSDNPMTDEDYLKKLSDGQKENMESIWSLVVSLFPLGAIFGGVMTGLVADKFGRKGGMLLNNILTFAGGLPMFLSKASGSHYLLYIGRFIIGLNCGLNSGLAPMYLTEISPVNYRGLLGTVNQLLVTIAILVSNILGLESLWGNASTWIYLLGFTMVPAVYQLIALPFCPESPRYLLITKGRDDSARNALVKLRQTVDVDGEMTAMQNEADRLREMPRTSLGQLVSNPVTRWALIIAGIMMLSQQFSGINAVSQFAVFSGINAVMFYSTQIFTQDANLSPHAARMATIGVTLVNVLMTFVSMAVVDKAGRRSLHLGGLSGMFVSTVLLVLCLDMSGRSQQWAAYASIVFVILFVVAFALGPGPIPWFYSNELFEQGSRGIANSLVVAINWGAAYLVGQTFPHVQRVLGPFSCLVFSVCLVVFIAFTWKFVPETKGKSVDQVNQDLRRAVGK